MNIMQKVLSSPKDYRFDVQLLGECKIASPARQRQFVTDDDRCVLTCDVNLLRQATRALGKPPSFEKSGPHRNIFHDPAWTRAAIVTCGGLCPGLNDVIKGLVQILHYDYQVQTIFGIRYGLRGFIPRYKHQPMMLNVDVVDTIHEQGGTILGSSRGGQDTGEIVDTLIRMNINVLFCIGGDGTLRATRDIAEECLKRKLAISVIGIPKTIDNDLNFIGRSFGFETAVYQTNSVIQSAHVEAKGVLNGIGLVKLMGRDSGFIAAFASLANSVVNFCLIPEVPFALDGPNGLLKALERRFDSGKDHCVMVVAEGAGQELLANEPERRDASGNVLNHDIGELLVRAIEAYFKKHRLSVSVKYFDPSYAIRSVPALGTDAILCYMLAKNAVHAAMAGRTNCVVGNLNNHYTLVPTRLATVERQKVDTAGELWKAVLDATHQESYFQGRAETLDAIHAEQKAATLGQG